MSNINEDTDITALARAVVKASKDIHNSKLIRVEELLFELQDIVVAEEAEGSSGRSRRRRKKRSSKKNKEEKETKKEEKVSIDRVDDYMGLLYDADIRNKIKGTTAIMKLACEDKHLETLLANDPLLSSLARVLADDYKHSMTLVLNIATVFFRFSRFSEMHSMIVSKSVGGVAIKIIDLELRRYRNRMTHMHNLEEGKGGTGRNSKVRGDDGEDRSVDLDREKKKTAVFVRKQDKVLHACVHMLLNLSEDLHVERKMSKKSIVELLARVLERENEHIRLLAVKFLTKLSKVGPNAIRMLELNVVSDVVEMISSPDATKGRGASSDALVVSVLRLLLNLSFNPTGRNKMIDNAIIPRLLDMLRKPVLRAPVLRLLYNLSIEDRCKSMVSYSEGGIAILLKLIVKFPKSKLPSELGGLVTNLTFVPENCTHIVRAMNRKGLHYVVKRMCEHPQDALMCSLVRNISQWTFDVRERYASDGNRTSNGGAVVGDSSSRDTKRSTGSCDEDVLDGLWDRYVDPLLCLAKKAQSIPSGQASLLHILGTLANLTPRDLPDGCSQSWASLIKKRDILGLLHGLLVAGSENDILQVTVMFLQTICLDEKCDDLICASKIPRLTVELLDDKRGDDDGLTVQILFSIYRMLRLPRTRELLLHKGDAIDAVCKCLGSDNTAVSSAVETVLDFAMTQDRTKKDGRVWDTIRARRFASHNGDWLNVVEEMDMDDGFVEEGKLYFDDGSTNLDSTGELDEMHGNDLDLSMSWRSNADDSDEASAPSRGGAK
eukprot:g1944.t1